MFVIKTIRMPGVFHGLPDAPRHKNILLAPGRYLLLLGLLSVVLAWPSGAHARNEPEISLVQTIEVKEYGGLQVAADVYEVKKGDTLAKILFSRGVISEGAIPHPLLKMVTVLNPNLQNPNLIRPGQKLVLPDGPVSLADLKEAESHETPAPAADDRKTAETAKSGGRTKKVTVKKGDTLYHLLRAEGFKRNTILNKLLKATVRLNPGVSSPDLIFEGQELLLPLTADAADHLSERRAESRAEEAPVQLTKPSKPAPPLIDPVLPSVPSGVAPPPEIKPSSSLASLKAEARNASHDSRDWKPVTAGTANTGLKAEAALPKTPVKAMANDTAPKVKAPEIPMPESVRNRTAISLIFSRLGERVFTKGKHFLPLKTGGQVIINNDTFPIIEMRSGRRIILDLDQRLPEDMLKIIRSNWSNYTVFRPKAKESLAGMLDRLFDLGQYFKLNKSGTPWIVQGRVTVRASADWIIWPTEEDYQQQRGVIVNILTGDGQETAPALAAYLRQIGIKVIDYNPKGNQIGPELDWSPGKVRLNRETIKPEGMMALIKALLGLVGQKYELDLSIPLVEDSSQAVDFQLTAQAPIYFTRDGKNYVVSVDPIAPEMVALLTKHQFEVVILPEDSPGFEAARKLLAAMKVKTSEGLTVKGAFRPDKKNIEVTAPGLMMSIAGHDILLTAITIPESLASMMARSNLEVIEYYLTPGGSPSGAARTNAADPEREKAASELETAEKSR